MDEAVRGYVDAIDPAYRPLFDRVHRLILTARRPGALTDPAGGTGPSRTTCTLRVPTQAV
jgi:hypothetical protein